MPLFPPNHRSGVQLALTRMHYRNLLLLRQRFANARCNRAPYQQGKSAASVENECRFVDILLSQVKLKMRNAKNARQTCYLCKCSILAIPDVHQQESWGRLAKAHCEGL